MSRLLVNDENKYANIAKSFHRTLILFTVIFTLSVFFAGKLPDIYGEIINPFREILNMLLFLITFFGLTWQLSDKRIYPLPQSGTRINRISRTVFIIIHIFIIISTASGVYAYAALNGSTDVYGLFSIPAVTEHDPDFGRAMLGLHELCAAIAFIFLMLHIGIIATRYYLLKDMSVKHLIPDIMHNIKRVQRKKQSEKIVRFPDKFKK